MKKAFRLLAVFLILLMVFTMGCNKKKKNQEESEGSSEKTETSKTTEKEDDSYKLAARGSSLVLSSGGEAVMADLAFLFDDGYQVLDYGKTADADEDGVTSGEVSFTAKKELDGGSIALKGTIFLGPEKYFWDLDGDEPVEEIEEETEEGEEEEEEDIEVVSIPLKELAELRLSAYSDNVSFKEEKKGDVTLWYGVASSGKANENGCQFYEMSAGGEVSDQAFYLSVNGMTTGCTDDEKAMAVLSDAAEKLWKSLKIEKGEASDDSLYSKKPVLYMTACEKELAGYAYDLASLSEVSFKMDGNTVSGRMELTGWHDLEENSRYLDGTLEIFTKKEDFECARDTGLSDLEADYGSSREVKKSGKNLDWSIAEASEDAGAFIAYAEKDGVYILCRMEAGSDSGSDGKSAYENCIDWLLSLELR